MKEVSRPKVYISYTWLTKINNNGKAFRDPDKRGYDLAERLRNSGIDSRVDMYFYNSEHGFVPPQPIAGDNRPAWLIWSGEQIKESDCVVLLCTPEYVGSDPDGGRCPGEWCEWHQMSEEDRLINRRPALWWDWYYMANELDTVISKPQKFIPVGFGPYDPNLVPGFIGSANYYNLDSEKHFESLLRRIKIEYRVKNPRQGVFISYAHSDEKKWLESLLRHLNPLKNTGIEIWTDNEIAVGAKWDESIKNSLSKAKVAILLVTPAFLDSPYITSHELPAFLQAAESDGLTIFWIPLKPSSYKDTEIAQFQAAHTPDQPLSGLRGAKLDHAFIDIVSRLKSVLATKI